MPRISCSVGSCSYNSEGICRASILNIGGKGAMTTEATCCGTYLNRLGYSNLADHTVNRGDTDAILCRVDTCAYNKQEHCSLSEIEVGSLEDVDIYTETDCLSFERR